MVWEPISCSHTHTHTQTNGQTEFYNIRYLTICELTYSTLSISARPNKEGVGGQLGIGNSGMVIILHIQ